MHYGSPRGEVREKGAERIFEEMMAENFLNLITDMNINIQEAQLTQGKMNSKRPTPRHIIIKQFKGFPWWSSG